MNKAEEKPQNIDLVDDLPGETRKRLFIGLIVTTSLLVCVVLGLLWALPYFGLESLHPYAPVIYTSVFVLLLLLVAWASLGLILNLMSGHTLPGFSRVRGLSVKLFLPLMTLIGRILGISKQRIRASFIKVNNELVDSRHKTYAPEEMLLLMPHCLQRSRCKVRLTYDVNNCKRCGQCPISGLLRVADDYGVSLAIATGGTIARRIVVQKRPKLILAVACERDLSAGIQDTYPLPVYGVLNERPFGPCLDTQVNLDHLETALRRFLHPHILQEIDARREQESDLEEAAPKTAKSLS